MGGSSFLESESFDPKFVFLTFDAAGSAQRLVAFGGPEVTSDQLPVGGELPGSEAEVGQFVVTRYSLRNPDNIAPLGIRPEDHPDLTDLSLAPDTNTNPLFRRIDTLVESKLIGDTGLLVASKFGEPIPDNALNVFMRGDLQITEDGRSSISVTTGKIDTVDGNTGLVFDGQMVGSTRLELAESALLISSKVGSTGPSFDLDAPHIFFGNTVTGERIGYVVLSQEDVNDIEEFFDGSQTTPSTAIERTLDGVETEYAFTRLAVGTEPFEIGAEDTSIGDLSEAGSRVTAAPEVGYAAGIAESLVDGQVVLSGLNVDSAGESAVPNVSFNAFPELNRLEAELDFSGTDYATDESFDLAAIVFGGSGENSETHSAYINNETFAARADLENNPDSFEQLDAGLIIAPNDLIEGIEDREAIQDYEHVQWGFWFGDILDSDAASEGVEARRVNLGYLVSGIETQAGDIRTGGSAAYSGHIAATIFTNGTLRDKIGSFTNLWNFGANTGSVTANLDSSTYTGTVTAPDRVRFSGTLDATNRIMDMNGSFFGPTVIGGPLEGSPPNMGGTVSITETAGDVYRGEGIFAGALDPN